MRGRRISPGNNPCSTSLCLPGIIHSITKYPQNPQNPLQERSWLIRPGTVDDGWCQILPSGQAISADLQGMHPLPATEGQMRPRNRSRWSSDRPTMCALPKGTKGMCIPRETRVGKVPQTRYARIDCLPYLNRRVPNWSISSAFTREL